MTYEDPWLRRFHPAPDAPVRLVCLPHAGGSASFYFPMARALAPAMDVLAVQYPGRQDRRHEPGVTRLTELADRIADALAPWTDRPLALFGHSMGGLLGYEIASRLEDAGHAPVALFASARRAPSRRRVESVHLRSDAGVIDELKLLDGTDSGLLLDDELLRMILPALRSDYEAIETYRHHPRPPLSTPIVALTGDTDPQVTADEAQSWSAHSSGGFALHTFEGGHFYLTRHQAEVLDVIRRTVARESAASVSAGPAYRAMGG
ncbi:alpha/beta fold hydrolase [Streptomyces sp. APSN-46.1]|uniref:thioesterase II family protein n=1 Tax=Streptomyces sp. APSN-46.1 TaxID=2929049 RepID=UPI001FB433DB|nr:alpha/beta fold hydrolase [Streptomyces sp. APSN-46.1]MCJ1678337.1 alpha/beta fold hydrolase [Streptomyces sp. APSN-46.1]